MWSDIKTLHKLLAEWQIQRGGKYSWKPIQQPSNMDPTTHPVLQTTKQEQHKQLLQISKKKKKWSMGCSKVLFFFVFFVCIQSNLNNMVLETDILLFLSSSILNIKNADQICSPASNNAVKHLKYDPWKHTQLRKRVWQS